MIEPVIERLPSKEWINTARELATSSGAVLIFDEIKTGFRLRTGGYQAFAEVDARSRRVREGDGERLSARRGLRSPRHHGRGAENVDLVDTRE